MTLTLGEIVDVFVSNSFDLRVWFKIHPKNLLRLAKNVFYTVANENSE